MSIPFYKKYKGPRGKHLDMMTHFTRMGEPPEEYRGTKRPGRIMMMALGKKYDPRKRMSDLATA